MFCSQNIHFSFPRPAPYLRESPRFRLFIVFDIQWMHLSHLTFQLGEELVHLTSRLDSPLSPALPRILKVSSPFRSLGVTTPTTLTPLTRKAKKVKIAPFSLDCWKVLIPAWSRLTEADSAGGRISVQQVKMMIMIERFILRKTSISTHRYFQLLFRLLDQFLKGQL